MKMSFSYVEYLFKPFLTYIFSWMAVGLSCYISTYMQKYSQDYNIILYDYVHQYTSPKWQRLALIPDLCCYLTHVTNFLILYGDFNVLAKTLTIYFILHMIRNVLCTVTYIPSSCTKEREFQVCKTSYDMIVSGHTLFILSHTLTLYKITGLSFGSIFSTLITIVGCSTSVLSREHYTVDVLLAILLMIPWFIILY